MDPTKQELLVVSNVVIVCNNLLFLKKRILFMGVPNIIYLWDGGNIIEISYAMLDDQNDIVFVFWSDGMEQAFFWSNLRHTQLTNLPCLSNDVDASLIIIVGGRINYTHLTL